MLETLTVNIADLTALYPMAHFCKNCGTERPTVSGLTSSTCQRHPDGAHKGKHVLYEGSEKPRYTCKHCGTERPSISSLTSATCPRHPVGTHKGRHEVAL